MDSERWNRISELVASALERPAGEREAFVLENTDGDEALRREVRSLLAGEASTGPFLEPLPAADLRRVAEADPDDRWVGRDIGPYRIERPIASGGMGRVFLARRTSGDFEQRVALKLVKRGMDTDRILERFRNERQVLASLEHPNIARLIDGGATDDGRPFLAMEFVEGEPIDRYCARRGLDLRQRVRLLLAVCSAVQHAHRSLIVHRDLKPANLLVTPDGVPKLLDFGLAKVLSPAGRSQTYDVTAEGERMLTPHYASPEQILGGAVTTAADVYALGVILYELVSGRRPYELDGLSWNEVERVVAQVDPPRASSTAAGTGDTRRARELTGDLDTILACALRKEAARRYGSVEALADDLRRWLDGLPITARPATLGYRTSKFVRRNRVLVVSAGAVFLALVGGIVATTRQSRLAHSRELAAEQARERAERALDNAEAVNDFMSQVLLAAQARELGADVTVREALDAAAARVEERLADRPWVEGSVRRLLGVSYRELGALPQAQEQLERAVELRTRELGPRDRATLTARYELMLVHYDLQRLDLARAQLAEIARDWELAYPEDLRGRAQMVEQAGSIAFEHFDLALAEELLLQALELYEQVGPGALAEQLVVRKRLASTLMDGGHLAEAESMLLEVIDAQTRLLGPDHPDTLISQVDLATTLSRLDRREEAEALYREALAGMERRMAPEAYDRLITVGQLADMLADQGRWDEVLELGEPTYDMVEGTLGAGHLLARNLRSAMTRAYLDLGLDEEARELQARGR